MGSLLVEPHVTEPLLESVEQAGLLKPFDPEQGRAKVVVDAISLLKQQQTDVPIIGNLTGPVSIAGTLVDMSTLLKEYHKKPEQSHALMDRIAQAAVSYTHLRMGGTIRAQNAIPHGLSILITLPKESETDAAHPNH